MNTRDKLLLVCLLLPASLLAQSLPAETQPSSAPATQIAAPASQTVLTVGQCGDGTLNQNEECDDGNILTSDGCSNACTVERCGDRVLQGGRGETCDDGNTADGDGCSAVCQREGGQRAPLFGFALSVAGVASGIIVGSLIDSQLPSLISFGLGPAVGHIYMRDYRKAGIYTGLRAGALVVVGVGLLIAGNSLDSSQVGDGIPFNAFPGDGTFLLGGALLLGGIAAYPTIAILDLAVQYNKYSMRPRRFGALTPSVGPIGRSSFGLSLRLDF